MSTSNNKTKTTNPSSSSTPTTAPSSTSTSTTAPITINPSIDHGLAASLIPPPRHPIKLPPTSTTTTNNNTATTASGDDGAAPKKSSYTDDNVDPAAVAAQHTLAWQPPAAALDRRVSWSAQEWKHDVQTRQCEAWHTGQGGWAGFTETGGK